MPRSSVFTGSLKLAIPEHSAYRQACEEQKKIATNMVVCRGGRLPTFSADAVPTVSEWDRHRVIAERMVSEGRVNRKVQRTPANTYGSPGARGLSDVLSIPPIGEIIINSLWKSDAASIGSLAATSKKCSDAVSLYVSRFNLPFGDSQDCDCQPEVVNDMFEDRDMTTGLRTNLFVRGRYSLFPFTTNKSPLGTWGSYNRRENLWKHAEATKDISSEEHSKVLLYLRIEQTLSEFEADLESKTASKGLTQYSIEDRAHHLRELGYTIPMLRSFSKFGLNLRAVRFHQVPMMDMRVLQLILPTMPSLEVLGLIDCELLHFGCVIPILDLIHWHFGQVQKKLKLDFYPRTYSAPAQQRQGTYFLSWESLNMDSVPRAVLHTAFIAVLKAHPMGIDLISEGQSFRKFLDRIPMKPGAMWIFIDALSSWQHACRHRSYQSLPPHMKRPLNHQLFLALHQGDAIDEHNHWKEMGQKWHCSECGCDMIIELFRYGSRASPAYQRICLACTLQMNLAAEKDHCLWVKRDLLTCLLQPELRNAPADTSPFETAKRHADYTKQQLRNAVAPLMPNPFIDDPAIDSIYRYNALDVRFALPDIKKLVSREWEANTLCASGAAAIQDVVLRMNELVHHYPDHGHLTRQATCNAGGFKQSWEHALWKDMDLPAERGEEMKPPGFW